jgi:penicillin-binding protein 1A
MVINKNLIIKLIAVLILAVFLIPIVFRISLPHINKILGAPNLSILEDYQPIGSIEIYDYKDNFIGVLQGEEDRQVIKLGQVSDYAIQALLAAEDSEFFKHSGFSLTSFFRALFTNIKAGKVVQGGSTISQQMVKNLFIEEDERYKRSLLRKVRELFIAFEVESKYPKEKILEIYLNQVYFGNLAYGIERAAQRYFSKPASKLELIEASYLAGLLTAPSYLSKNNEAAFERQKYVLKKMFENGYISNDEYQKALNTKVEFKYSEGNLSKFPYYFSLVEQELAKRFTRNELKSLGLKVYTGLDPVAQAYAVETLNTGIKNAAAGINQGALVTIDVESAEVRALVGGVGNFWAFQYNRATNPHTLGSAIKPFIYLTAFMQGVIDPSSVIEDEPLLIPDVSSETGFWEPQNFDEEFHGPITAKAALVFSRNIPAIKVAMKAGIKNVIETCRLAGIRSKMDPLLSFALGAQAFTPLDIASAYSTFARGGARIDPIIIRRITDTKGRVLEVNKPVVKSNIPERYVGQLVGILTDVVNYGTGSLAKIPGRIIAGKTGTADGGKDIWFVGFTPEYVTSVWCGNERNKEVLSRYATGGSTPAWVWREYMTKYYNSRPRPPRTFHFTERYKLVAIDPITGMLANDYTPNPIFKRFEIGTEPTEISPIPMAEKIRPRGRSKFFSFRQRLSKEDKELKSAKNSEDSESDDDEGTGTGRRSFIPQPKEFEIHEASLRKSEEQSGAIESDDD